MNENEYININRVTEAKGLKSNRSLRLEINKPESKYIAHEVKVNGGTSYEILYSSLEPEIQQKLRENSNKSTALVPLNYQPTTFVSESARLKQLVTLLDEVQKLPPNIPKLALVYGEHGLGKTHSVIWWATRNDGFWNVYEIPDTIEEARKLLKKYEYKYNCERMHQSLNYLTPMEY